MRRLFITAVPITKYRTFVALCDEAFLVSGWNVHSMRGTCASRRVLRKVSFFCVGERRARRAQAEGRGTAPGGRTETVLVFSGAEVCCCVGDVGFVQPVAGR